jgi:hypothetical protein
MILLNRSCDIAAGDAVWVFPAVLCSLVAVWSVRSQVIVPSAHATRQPRLITDCRHASSPEESLFSEVLESHKMKRTYVIAITKKS